MLNVAYEDQPHSRKRWQKYFFRGQAMMTDNGAMCRWDHMHSAYDMHSAEMGSWYEKQQHQCVTRGSWCKDQRIANNCEYLIVADGQYNPFNTNAYRIAKAWMKSLRQPHILCLLLFMCWSQRALVVIVYMEIGLSSYLTLNEDVSFNQRDNLIFRPHTKSSQTKSLGGLTRALESTIQMREGN